MGVFSWAIDQRPAFRTAALAFALVVTLHGAYAFGVGIQGAGDSRRYSRMADRLIELRFDYPTFLVETKALTPPFMYLGFITLVAAAKLALGSSWPQGIVAVNLLCEALVAVLLTRLLRRVAPGALPAAAALLLVLVTYELFSWVPYALSDITFVFVSFAVFCVATRGLFGVRRRGLVVCATVALTALACVCRPAGPILVPLVALTLGAGLLRARLVAAVRGRPRLLGAALAGIVAIGIATALMYASIMQNTSSWPLGPLRSTLAIKALSYARGEIASFRPESSRARPLRYADYAAITGARFVHFFALGDRRWSLTHNLASALVLGAAYLLAGLAVVAAVRVGSPLEPEGRIVVVLSLVFVLAIALFHAFVGIDYDWRYRAPILPHLIFLASVGATQLRPARRPGQARGVLG